MMAKVRVPKKKLWKAIRKHCLECSGDSSKEVNLCLCDNCPLYPFRMGRIVNKSSNRVQFLEEYID